MRGRRSLWRVYFCWTCWGPGQGPLAVRWGEVLKQGSSRRGMSSRANLAAYGAGPGVDLYLLVTCPLKGVGKSFRWGVVDEGLVME